MSNKDDAFKLKRHTKKLTIEENIRHYRCRKIKWRTASRGYIITKIVGPKEEALASMNSY